MRKNNSPGLNRKNIIWYILICIITIAVFYKQFVIVKNLKGKLSPIADPYSEANAIREAASFYNKGLFRHFGLGDINYGNLFQNEGNRSLPGVKKNEPHVYTHYPPGPAYILTALMYIFGEKNYSAFRFFAVTIACICCYFFFAASMHTLGHVKSLILTVFIFSFPAVTNMSHGLHYQGYAYSILFLQTGVLLLFLKGSIGLQKACIVTGSLAFIQGYLSFDFAMITMFHPIFLLATTIRMRHLLLLCAASSLGFVFAHFIHFVQVCFYFRSVNEAVTDLFLSAAQRKASSSSILDILYSYTFIYFPSPDYFNIHFLWLQLPICLFLLLGITKPAIIFSFFTVNFSKRIVISVIAVFIVSQLWLIIMKGHAYFHSHFLPRHYLYMILSYSIIILTNINRPKKLSPL